MLTLSRKAKQFLTVVVKLLIVGGAFYFIYSRLMGEGAPDWQKLNEALKTENALLYGFIILALTFLNRFLEIIKWQNLVSSFSSITLGNAAKQVLAAMTAALFTPNGIGEYAAKALYYKKEHTKNIIFLNLVCNGIQLIIAVLAGLFGFAIFNTEHNVIPDSFLFILLAVLLITAILLFTARNFTIKGHSLNKVAKKVNALPKTIHRKNMLLALGRYFCLIHQHYFLFLLFGVDLPYAEMLAIIAAVYFLGSSLPTFQLFDFAVRGGVAVFFFGLMGVNEWIVVFAATLQWLHNIVIPVSIGSYFVFRFKPAEATPH